ncbi:MAG: galactoside ABC transporter permease [Treponemataceae bacterium]|nr:galactoside ABC transporter permease [Treponemataceae bacterium]
MAVNIEEIRKGRDEALKKLPESIASKTVKSLDEDEVLRSYKLALTELRKDGVHKILDLKQDITAAKKNRMLEKAQCADIIADCKKQIGEAKAIAARNKNIDNMLTKEAVAYADTVSAAYVSQVNEEQDSIQTKLKEKFKKQLSDIKADYSNRISKMSDPEEIKIAKFECKSELFDLKSKYQSEIDHCKDIKNQAFVDHVQTNRALRNGRQSFSENISLNFKNYVYQFKMSQFMLNNGLYLAILVFFIVCIVIAPLSGNGQLLSLPNILTILEQSSTRMFYALGVAGLILIAGTDLSVCRMVALGAVTTGLILHPTKNIVSFFGMEPWDFTGLPMGGRLVMALGISIALCVFFSCFAGFFTARFKIHPFISTLSSQLIIYGLLFFGTSGTPVGSIDSNIKDLIGGRWILGVMNGSLITFPKLIIPAIIAIFVAWFIWNKTTFGKNMYAVGGNSEAAAVSGINVFGVTMGIFIMAGIFYGCGAFLEAFRANASAGTGQGFELDAIAACVVGGISFNGGIGKIRGAVLGVIIFTGLTYCLTFLGIDTNLQFVFKGFIIIAAVALDSVKYLKRK